MPALNRRDTLKSMSAVAALMASGAVSREALAQTRPAPIAATELKWLDGAAPARFEGATLGVPWPRGAVKLARGEAPAFRAGDAAVQSWPLAYWPDGSLKWTAHAVAAGTAPASLSLTAGQPAAAARPITVRQAPQAVLVTCGDLAWTIPTAGEALIASATRAGRVTLSDMKLVALWQDKPELSDNDGLRQQRFTSKVTRATVEQTGPVRAVVRLEGVHSAGGRDWLPFVVRLYFYAGSDAVRLVHSFIYDGEPAKDFIAGLGVTADVPMSGETYDRHIRLSGEGRGIWGEAVRPVTGLRRDPGAPYKAAQVEGRALPPLDGMAEPVRRLMKWIPEWGDFSLTQLNSDGFTIKKRTRAGHAWIDSNAGTRTPGLAFVGGPTGGVALGLKDFWQRAPTGLDIRGAQTDSAQITAWMWSPQAPAMDVRSYRSPDGMDTHPEEIEGLDITYEDYEAGWDTAHGVARTSELTLWALPATPSHQAFSDMAHEVATPARLVLTPARLHQAGVFGDWSPADSSTPTRKLIEDRLTYQIDHYMKEVEQRRWYGFWTYGDVMHSQDVDRHVWKYDIGGYAWDNGELSSDLWVWYTYLRTGRADVFRFAEAMTRQNSEVDVYHLGRFKGFGTRHGIQPWSDSSKQPRVSTAAFRRFYYYLTADERVGDLMRDLVDSDHLLKNVDISRKLPPSPERDRADAEAVSSFGTTWGSFIAAWLTEWERTGDTRWRDRILNGMETIGGMKRGWFAASAPYDLKTGRFLGEGDYVAFSNLNNLFGVVEMSSELLDLLDAPKYRKAWLQYCRYVNAPAEEQRALLGVAGLGTNDERSRLTAYAAHHEKDRALALRAWSEFLGRRGVPTATRARRVEPPVVLRAIDEDPGLSTNSVSQWSLAAIQNLALVGDVLEEAAGKAGVGR